MLLSLQTKIACPDSSVVEHLHGKQAVEGSIPFLGKKEKNKYINVLTGV